MQEIVFWSGFAVLGILYCGAVYLAGKGGDKWAAWAVGAVGSFAFMIASFIWAGVVHSFFS